MTDPATLHLRPAAPLAERVLLPGDPHRALAVAQALLDGPKMFNHNRGLWGYTGTARDGEPLTVQATGMGGPSTAIVVEELIDLGARVLLRIGTCGALREGFELGELLAAERVIGADGTSAALGAGPRLAPDPALTQALAAGGASPRSAAVISVAPPMTYPTNDRLETRAGPSGLCVPMCNHSWRGQGPSFVTPDT